MLSLIPELVLLARLLHLREVDLLLVLLGPDLAVESFEARPLRLSVGFALILALDSGSIHHFFVVEVLLPDLTAVHRQGHVALAVRALDLAADSVGHFLLLLGELGFVVINCIKAFVIG